MMRGLLYTQPDTSRAASLRFRKALSRRVWKRLWPVSAGFVA
jgi:hypothetical protein